MKDTSNFRTKTSFMPSNNRYIKGAWTIGLDIGYGGVKIKSPNIVARFPSYAKKVSPDFAFADGTSNNAIMYKNLNTNETWIVGAVAQNIMSATDTTDSESTLYGREWFTTAMYAVLAETGLGVAMQKLEIKDSEEATFTREPGDDKIIIQTGLPECYMSNAEELREALSGRHDFALKIGKGAWQEFHIEIDFENIFCMSQPKGTLMSVCMDKTGHFHADAKKYLSSSVIVFDAGFNTLDIFPILAGTVQNGETFANLGMKRILQETSNGIRREFHVDIPVPAMQKYLETGKVRYKSHKKGEFISKEYEFGDILAQSSIMVCEEAIEKMASAISLLDYNYLIVTGGTGAAWFNQITEKFKNFETLQVIQGNINNGLPFVYTNVEGYYDYRCYKVEAETRQTR